MNPITSSLTDLFNRIPRRHSLENVKEINSIVSAYEEQLMTIESKNPFYEKNAGKFFDDLENARSLIKKSTDNKASKKAKDDYFGEASDALKDSIQSLIGLYGNGERTE